MKRKEDGRVLLDTRLCGNMNRDYQTLLLRYGLGRGRPTIWARSQVCFMKEQKIWSKHKFGHVAHSIGKPRTESEALQVGAGDRKVVELKMHELD